jgi:hypothetical protein
VAANQPGAERADSVGEREHVGHFVFADEPVAKEPLEVAGCLTALATRRREALALLLRRIAIGPLGDERLGSQRGAQQLIAELVVTSWQGRPSTGRTRSARSQATCQAMSLR